MDPCPFRLFSGGNGHPVSLSRHPCGYRTAINHRMSFFVFDNIMRFIKLNLILLACIIITGCVNSNSKNISGEGIIDFERAADIQPLSDEICATFGGSVMDRNENNTLDENEIETKNYFRRVKRSIYISNSNSDEAYECVIFGERFLLGLIKERTCCFKPVVIPAMIRNYNEDSMNKMLQNLEETKNQKLEEVRKDFDNSAKEMEEAKKIIDCVNQGMIIDDKTGECKKFKPAF